MSRECSDMPNDIVAWLLKTDLAEMTRVGHTKPVHHRFNKYDASWKQNWWGTTCCGLIEWMVKSDWHGPGDVVSVAKCQHSFTDGDVSVYITYELAYNGALQSIVSAEATKVSTGWTISGPLFCSGPVCLGVVHTLLFDLSKVSQMVCTASQGQSSKTPTHLLTYSLTLQLSRHASNVVV